MSTSSRSREAKDLRHSTMQETISIKSSNTSSVSSGTSNSSSESESETENRPKKARGAKSNKSLKTSCGHCGKVGYKSLFFGKEKKYCCVGCSRAEGRAEELKNASTPQTKFDKKVPVIKLEPLSSSSISMPSSSTKMKTDEKRAFDWKSYLVKPNFFAAPVANFKHVGLSSMWGKITIGLKLEVENTDCPNYGTSLPSFYWIATIIKTAGYMAQLRYEGFGADDSQDFWVNMCTDEIYAVGWCASKGKPLIPPKSIESKCADWKQYLMKRLAGTRTTPSDFAAKIEEGLNTNIQRSMKLEVVDKNRISAIRVATVSEVYGGRLHVTYENPEEKNEDFWCHERSPLIHPIGWAQLIGHELRASPEYAKQSLQKVLFRDFEPDDATWDLFMRVQNPITDMKFKEGMKLEAIDPLNLSTICVATVTKVLRNNYLMIGIDGMMAANGSDCFCYHASSPCIFPVGFCETNSIPLTPPRGYKTEFRWDEYLRQTKSTAASVSLFRKEIPDHGFTEGMYLEAVDLMEPRLICVGFVAKVVGRLLRIHFDGWEDAYDQWCDCESPDLYPIGWCQAVGYRLEPPRTEAGEDSIKKRKKVFIYKGNRKRKRGSSLGKKMVYQSGAMSSRMAEKHEESRDSSQAKSSEDSNEFDSSFEKKSENSPGHDSKSSNFSFSESDPSKWTVAEVTKFLRINECGSYSHIFNEQKIDGPKFLNLTKEGLINLTGMKVGPSLKISHLIQQLKSN